MKISIKWLIAMTVVMAALLVFQTALHSQAAGTIKWANGTSFTSCNGGCTVALSWSPSAFSDTSYTASCSAIQGSSNLSLSISSETSSQVTVWLQDTSGSNSTVSAYGFQCIAVHN